MDIIIKLPDMVSTISDVTMIFPMQEEQNRAHFEIAIISIRVCISTSNSCLCGHTQLLSILSPVICGTSNYNYISPGTFIPIQWTISTMWKSLTFTGQQTSQAARCFNSTARTTGTSMRKTAGHRSFMVVPPSRKNGSQGDDFHDRESLSPERNEGTKSGTDNEVAQHPSAYDPSNTDPESELEAAGHDQPRDGQQRNPLNMSAANQGISAWRRPNEGGSDRNADRGSSSAKGNPKKSRTIHVKEDGTHVSYR